MKPSAADGRDPHFSELLGRHRSLWVPMFLARAALGCTSVVAVRWDDDGSGEVALISPAEASAWLKQRSNPKASAKVVGTPPPGHAWALGQHGSEASVWSLSMATYLRAT